MKERVDSKAEKHSHSRSHMKASKHDKKNHRHEFSKEAKSRHNSVTHNQTNLTSSAKKVATSKVEELKAKARERIEEQQKIDEALQKQMELN